MLRSIAKKGTPKEALSPSITLVKMESRDQFKEVAWKCCSNDIKADTANLLINFNDNYENGQ